AAQRAVSPGRDSRRGKASASQAKALADLAGRLRDVGRNEEALQAVTEAVSQYRQLAETRPTRYWPGLADALVVLAECLDRAGRHEEALAAATDGVTVQFQLADADLSHLPTLLTSLQGL